MSYDECDSTHISSVFNKSKPLAFLTNEMTTAFSYRLLIRFINWINHVAALLVLKLYKRVATRYTFTT